MSDIPKEKKAIRKKRIHAAGWAAVLFGIVAPIMIVLFFGLGNWLYHSDFYELLNETNWYPPIYRFVSWMHECCAFLSVSPWYGIFFGTMLKRAKVSLSHANRRVRIICAIALIPFSLYLIVLGAVGAERAEASRANPDCSHISTFDSPEVEHLKQKNAWRISIKASASGASHSVSAVSKESYSGASLFFHYFWRNPSTVFSCLIKNYPVTFYVVEIGDSPPSPSPSPSVSQSAGESSFLSTPAPSSSPSVKPAIIKIEDPLVIKEDNVLYHRPYEGREVDWDSKRDIEFRGNSGACSAFSAEKEVSMDITEQGTAAWSIDSSLPAAQGLLRQEVDIAPGETAYFYYPSSYFLLDDNALADLEKEYGAKLQIDKIGFESSSLQQPGIEAADFHGEPVFLKTMTGNEDASLQIRCYLNGKKRQDYYVTLAAANSPSWNAVRPGAPDPDLICNLYLSTKR